MRSTEIDPGSGVRRLVPLTPRHQVGVVSMWEAEGRRRIGVEWYYIGRQRLEDDPFRSTSRPYVLAGLLAEQRFGPARVFVNFENLTNVRQTRTSGFVRPTPGQGGRWTTDVWAPLEGRVINAGVRWTFGAREREHSTEEE
jgi:iron complex outermembrane receptor protein